MVKFFSVTQETAYKRAVVGVISAAIGAGIYKNENTKSSSMCYCDSAGHWNKSNEFFKHLPEKE